MFSDSDIQRLVTRIVSGYAPLAVGIFGSYAIGRAHAGSDLDIVVIKDVSEAQIIRGQRVRRLLFDVLGPLDIHVFIPDEFEAAAQVPQSFEWIIARQARMLFFETTSRRSIPSLSLAPNYLWNGSSKAI
jgi:uncharacterized protein